MNWESEVHTKYKCFYSAHFQKVKGLRFADKSQQKHHCLLLPKKMCISYFVCVMANRLLWLRQVYSRHNFISQRDPMTPARDPSPTGRQECRLPSLLHRLFFLRVAVLHLSGASSHGGSPRAFLAPIAEARPCGQCIRKVYAGRVSPTWSREAAACSLCGQGEVSRALPPLSHTTPGAREGEEKGKDRGAYVDEAVKNFICSLLAGACGHVLCTLQPHLGKLSLSLKNRGKAQNPIACSH